MHSSSIHTEKNAEKSLFNTLYWTRNITNWILLEKKFTESYKQSKGNFVVSNKVYPIELLEMCC